MIKIIQKKNYLIYIKDSNLILINFSMLKIEYKKLSKIEGRALIYQKILLESEMVEKLKLLRVLKNSLRMMI